MNKVFLQQFVLVVLIALIMAGCASSGPGGSRPKQDQDRAPQANQSILKRLEQLPDPKVVPVKPGKRGNGPVYTVFGKSYRVMNSARGFKQEGLASWYGLKFHGRETSSGEVFDTYKLTAAHKHLPLPIFVKVTNLQNNRQTIVRVNDRGPFHGDRIIDLSYAAAVKLGFHTQGTARVRIEVVEPVKAPAKPASKPKKYIARVGEFKSFAEASEQQSILQSRAELSSVIIKLGNGLYALQFDPLGVGQKLDRLRALLLTTDLPGLQILRAP